MIHSARPDFPKKLEIIEAQADALRDEIRGRLETNSALWKMGLIGVGAIVVLKPDIVLENYLPLVPFLGITLAYILTKQNLILFRVGRSIAFCERHMNNLLGETILDHEIKLWNSRKENFRRWRPLLLVLLILTPFHLLLIRLYMTGSKLGTSRRLSLPVYAASAVINFLLIVDFRRLWILLNMKSIKE